MKIFTFLLNIILIFDLFFCFIELWRMDEGSPGF